jgi:low molecular weight protein-tyrosine phosphatase
MKNKETITKQRILFLCTGNYYRSRFAEIYFNWHAERRGLFWTADSRGLAIDPYLNGPISRHTLAGLHARGIVPDTVQRSPLPVVEADLAAADHIIAVKDAEHRPIFEANFPTWRDRIEYWHIHDLDCAPPDVAISHLEREVTHLLGRLTARRIVA